MKFEYNKEKSVPELENDVIKFWKENKIFEKSVENRPEDDLYVFYDGPPFISGLPHYGHIVVSIAKDLIPRYWTMKGKRVERVWGWDAHGLTVENKVQKKLGIKNRRDIEDFGLEKFTEECYTYTSETSAEWNWYIDKIGRWVDMENAYKTIDQNYMESVMWAFKQLFDKGLIYEGVRTSLYCTTCGTPVSNFEVAMDNTYKLVTDPSVFVKFKLKDADKVNESLSDAYLLAWTTTPWTLPSNRALVVDPNEDYSVVEFDGDKIVLGTKRVDAVFTEKNGEYKELTKVKGSELLGLSYEPLYDFFAANENDFKVYSYEGMVTTEEGTGCVHSAPGFGMVDTEMGQATGLTVMLTIDDEGKYIAGSNGENPFEGMYYKKADKYITQDLIDRGIMFTSTTIEHRFPYHDRCDTLLIQKAQNSWFVDVASLKDQLLKTNEDILWVPDHLKEGRFAKGIEQAPDWCISRSRFWATPMPVWEADDGDRIVIGSVAELEELSGQKVKNLHRPYIDQITIEKDGKTYKRRPEVLDSWFEAGSMPYASIHYPYDNKEKFESHFPGDFIVEYIAQTRAWFYVMHVLSVALFGQNSFKNVIGYGVLAGNDGRKMSKTYGNYTDPKEVLENIGGDAVRLYFMNSPLMTGSNTNFDLQGLKTKLTNVLNPLWNSAKFFAIYATEHNWSPSDALVNKMSSENWANTESDNPLDQWIMLRLAQTHAQFVENIEKYEIPAAVEPLETFVDDLSRWYVRRSRERLSSGDKNALETLYTVLYQFSLMSAPVTPFVSESIYQLLGGAESGVSVAEGAVGSAESVHLCDFNENVVALTKEDEALLEQMRLTRDAVSLILSLRTESSVKVRQPLSTAYVVGENLDSNSIFTDIVQDEANLKEVLVGSSFDSLATNKGSSGPSSNEPSNNSKNASDLAEMPTMSDSTLEAKLDVTITEELEIEGAAREVVRSIQALRKKAGLEVSDEIKAQYESNELNDKAVKVFGDDIKEKVGASELVSGGSFEIL